MTVRSLVVAVALVLVAASCGSSRDGDAVVANIGDLGHVHDIVVDDSDVYLAAHSGLFRVEGPTRAVLVGEFRHDFMSMTSGADGLVASGHPDLRFDEWRVEGKPAHLGFVASDDLGGSWTPVSLLGEVDFHSLTSRSDGGFYGADSSGVILASSTGDDWEQRSSMQSSDLAASPDDAGSLLGIDADTGLLMLSDDGAQSWTVVANAPVLRRVQWRSDKIVGVATDGTLYETPDLGGSWSVLGQVDEEPVAFTSRDSEYWIVTDDAGVLHSDNGSDFRTVYTAPDRPGA